MSRLCCAITNKSKFIARRENFLIMSDVYVCMSVQNFFLEASDMPKCVNENMSEKKRAMRWGNLTLMISCLLLIIFCASRLLLLLGIYPLISFSLWLTQSITPPFLLLADCSVLALAQTKHFSAMPQELVFSVCAIFVSLKPVFYTAPSTQTLWIIFAFVVSRGLSRLANWKWSRFIIKFFSSRYSPNSPNYDYV